MELQKIPSDILFSEFKRRYHCSQITDPKKIVLLGYFYSMFNSDPPVWAKAPNLNFYKNDSVCARFPRATFSGKKSASKPPWVSKPTSTCLAET